MKHWTENEDYLKMLIDYDTLALELDPEKIKSLFHRKMEQGAADVLLLDFMDFSVREYVQLEQVIKDMPKYTKH